MSRSREEPVLPGCVRGGALESGAGGAAVGAAVESDRLRGGSGAAARVRGDGRPLGAAGEGRGEAG